MYRRVGPSCFVLNRVNKKYLLTVCLWSSDNDGDCDVDISSPVTYVKKTKLQRISVSMREFTEYYTFTMCVRFDTYRKLFNGPLNVSSG